ncbi:MAG: DUF484 family protein [Pseudomonadales bacterium]
MSANKEAKQPQLKDADVVAYLRANRDFFVDNKFLLSELNLPHASGRAVSLVERQVDILRERNVVMRKRMNDLLNTARHNDGLFNKTRSLTLALLDCTSLQALNEILATHVLADFEADFVACHLSSEDKDRHSDAGPLDHFFFHSAPPAFTQLITSFQATCTPLRSEEVAAIFPLSETDSEGSAVLIPFVAQQYEGTLAIGSRDPGHFASDMDTLFVTYIADVLSKVLGGHL